MAGFGETALLTAGLIAVAVVVVYTLRLGAPPWPSSPRARRVLLEAVPTESAIDGEILELGCGWGGLALALAARYPDRRVLGVELSPVPWAVARLRALAGRVGNLEIQRADLHRVDLSGAGLIVCYLNRDAMSRLAERAATEARPGTWIVSNTFGLGDGRPVARRFVGDLYRTEILVYRIGEDSDGISDDATGPRFAHTRDC
ncbi:methyltransferase domain-containing protein [Rhodospira trueperi]|uniref:Methyltransferase domain-containing protein n=1 Tax=Rhodospira trueperi TaxID=69960 RepID=A0A1G7G255_9PROT|nr:class I SAM-dependent methyltransferase [Rhodospira trueperi]SDE82183.1 Methyltransferase domain-containing protein [Rhodospira trueperi]